MEPSSLPADLRPTAWSEDGVLMAFEHTRYPVFGMQFHPESILTEHGYEMLANFLRLAGISGAEQSANRKFRELVPRAIDSSANVPDRPVTF